MRQGRWKNVNTVMEYIEAALCISVGTNTDFSLKANGDFGFARTLISGLVEQSYQISLALSVKFLLFVKGLFVFSARNPPSTQV